MTDSDTIPSAKRSPLALFALDAAVLWLLAGALFKLFRGSPADLPQPVLEFAKENLSFDPLRTYLFAISAELLVVIFALLRPRIGWVLVMGQFLVFLGVLYVVGDTEGWDADCGCMGGNNPLVVWHMMAIDGALLLFILFTRPWRNVAPVQSRPLLLLGLAAAAVLLPPKLAQYIPPMPAPKASPAALPGNSPALPGDAVIEEGSGAPGTGAQPVAPAAGNPPGEGESAAADPLETAAKVGPEVVANTPQAAFAVFEPDEWAGQDVYTIPLAKYLPTSETIYELPFPAHVILYRNSCEVCATHLVDLTTDPTQAITDRQLVLIRIPDDPDAEPLVTVKPEGALDWDLQVLPRGYVITTPYAFDVNAEAKVTNVTNLRKKLGH